jgi:S1-C subfamily serine protease
VGAVIYSVVSGSPAADAGLRQGDIITQFNGKEITHYNLLNEYLSDCKPQQKVSIKIYRAGKYLDGTVTVGSNNSQ